MLGFETTLRIATGIRQNSISTAIGLLAIFAAVLITQGCATPPPTAEELRRADYGPPPSDYKMIIATHLAETLKDPLSAQVEFLNQPTKAWTNWTGDLEVGWGVCVAVNAKNSFGAYTGFELHYFLIKRDRIIKPVLSTAVDWRTVTDAARAGCDRVVQARSRSTRGASLR